MIPPPRLAGPVPPPAPLPFWQYLQTARHDFVAAFHADVYSQNLVAGRFLGRPSFIVNDPAAIKRVLLDRASLYIKVDIEHRILGPGLGNGLITSEGDTWKTHRRLMAPAFDGGSVRGYAPVMVETARQRRERWLALPPGTIVEVSAAMMEVTLEIIARCMFSAEGETLVDTVQSASARYQDAMMAGPADFVPLLGSILGYCKGWRGRRILRRFDAAIYDLIRERAQAGAAPRQDLLARLIDARDDETGGRLSAQEIRDQVFTIFVAGHETTALALTWTWYLLSLHPAPEAKLHAELDGVLAGRAPTFEDLPRLPYARMVIQEAMRLYPPVHSLAWREPLEDDELCGRRVPKGAIIQIVPWVLHRHRRFWDTPERFDPERFSPERSEGRERFAYLPFSYGPRVCIGAAFATTEAVLILATLAQHFRLRLPDGQAVDTQAQITLRPRGGLKMILERRTGGH